MASFFASNYIIRYIMEYKHITNQIVPVNQQGQLSDFVNWNKIFVQDRESTLLKLILYQYPSLAV